MPSGSVSDPGTDTICRGLPGIQDPTLTEVRREHPHSPPPCVTTDVAPTATAPWRANGGGGALPAADTTPTVDVYGAAIFVLLRPLTQGCQRGGSSVERARSATRDGAPS